MVHRSSDSSLIEVEAGPITTSELSVSPILNLVVDSHHHHRRRRGRVVVEEFPRVEGTEIVRLREDEEEGESESESEVKTANVEELRYFPAASSPPPTSPPSLPPHHHLGGINAECLSDRQNVQPPQRQNQNQNHQNQRRSGRFSIFNWFKKGITSPVSSQTLNPSVESSSGYKLSKNRELRQSSIYSSSASVDTSCSTATVHSFTFRPGSEITIAKRCRGRLKNHRKYFSADDFAAEPQLKQFDSEPSIHRDYLNCVNKNGGNNNDIGYSSARAVLTDGEDKKKKQKEEEEEEAARKTAANSQKLNNQKPRFDGLESCYRSLPTAGKNADLTNSKKRNVHVRGKRRAPKPPVFNKFQKSDPKSNTVARRKRQAPKPPGVVKPDTDLDLKIPKNVLKTSIIVNDSLRLEDGILLPTKTVSSAMSASQSAIKKPDEIGGKKGPSISCATNTALPRPWYKRSNTTLSERDICGSFRREILKAPTACSKPSKDAVKASGRFSFHHETTTRADNSPELNSQLEKSFSRLNHLFGRNEAASIKSKKDDKRKSNLSILANISELDREAAAIVQQEQARNKAAARSSLLLLSTPAVSTAASANELEAKTTSGEIISDMVSSSIEPQRRGTRALISKFNAISNITKVTVNATFFTKSTPSKTDVGRAGEAGKNRSDRCSLVTKRLVCDGTERVNETTTTAADVSSINFFRRLEAEASGTPDNTGLNSTPAATGWEEKIKRYFPEKGNKRKDDFDFKPASNTSLEDTRRNYFANEIENSEDRRRDINKIEHLSRADLKEMLIEMKHSLPKRPKPKSAAISARKSQPELINEGMNRVAKFTDAKSAKTGGKTQPQNVLILTERKDTEKIIPHPVVIDAANCRKTKVSSAAQTSANIIRRVETPALHNPRERQCGKYGGKKAEDTKGRIKSGGGLARNTFQLIRPRDFACIEALKTEKGGSAAGAVSGTQNTYMNVIEDSIYANAVINPANINTEGIKCRKIEAGDQGDKKPRANTTADYILKRYAADSKVRELETTRILGGGDGKQNGPETNMNTMAINRLLRKLEGAIASGQHQQAAGLAKELAQLKIHCSVVRQRTGNDKAADFINVDMYIEDKLAHQGPIPLQLSLNMTVAELKKKVFAEFEIPANVQRWIIGKNLADNDDFTINELKAVDKSSIFLYLVAPDLQNEECTRVDKPPVVKEETPEVVPVDEEPQEIAPIVDEEVENKPPEEPTVEELKIQRYEHLMSLENSDVIPNSVPIECPICFAPYGPCEGVILRDCLHMFCRTCIANTIKYCEEAEVKCPFRDSEYTCESTLQEREIKALVTPEIYEQHLAKSVSQAENNAGNNAFHCKTPDCPGWCIYDDNVNVFLCPVCGVNNCLTCQAIHMEKNCREYQDEIRLLKETDQETKRTAAVLEEMVESGEALACPTCAVVLMKKWGCDWLRCSMCKTEICWVTRGPRWGPAGKGDTSGGCKCGENGVKCHPRCNYCH